jgi:hypothetical protein
MSQPAAVFIMMSNYFHDVATAMIMASSVTMWVILRRYEKNSSPGSIALIVWLYKGISKVVIFSWGWILSAGILRFLTFRTYEWPNAVEKHQEYGLMVKYGIALAMMAGGAYLWMVLIKKMRALTLLHRER